MKHKNRLKLARMAAANVWHGGVSALVLARRIMRLFPGSEAMEIVDRVYTHPRGVVVYECRECGSEHLTQEERAECCALNQDD